MTFKSLNPSETLKVYLSRIHGPSHCVFRALVIRSSPMEMKLFEPVGACDGSICQSCRANTRMVSSSSTESPIPHSALALHQYHKNHKNDDNEMTKHANLHSNDLIA